MTVKLVKLSPFRRDGYCGMVWDLHSFTSVAMSSVDISWKAALKPLKIQQGMHQRSAEKGLKQVNILTRATLTILAKHCVMLPIEKKKQAGRLDICSIFGRALNEGNAQVLPTSLSPTHPFCSKSNQTKNLKSNGNKVKAPLLSFWPPLWRPAYPLSCRICCQ